MSEEATLTKEETVNPIPEQPPLQAAEPVSEPAEPFSSKIMLELVAEPAGEAAGEAAEEVAEEVPAESPEPDEAYDYFEDEKPAKRFFHLSKEDKNFSRDEWILSHIGEEHLLDYLKLEQKRTEQLQQVKDIREKRILTAFRLTVSLAAIVAVVFLLKDNPTILVNILYIAGILAVLWVWKNPKDKK